MNTPEQIAAEIATRPAAEIENTDLQELLMEAIEIDRAQHGLRYASQIIRRHNARAVIWERGDAESVLDDMIEGGVIEEPTPDEYAEIVGRAMSTYSWDSLSDRTEGGWDIIREAVGGAL